MKLSLAQWRALWLSVPGCGSETLKALEADESPETAAGRLAELSQACVKGKELSVLSAQQKQAAASFFTQTDKERLVESWRKAQIKLVADTDPTYPAQLKVCPDHPLVLFIKGVLPPADSLHLGIIGTRRPTLYGQAVTQLLVGQCVQRQAVIVSGLMIGIDSQAHQSTLAYQGKTVGVVGYGFEHCYPRNQLRLTAEILEKGGALVSEWPPSVPPAPHTFVLRNRIIAGLSKFVLVVEAAPRSGTMITVRYALEYGRSVGAVPGPITSQYSQGTAALLKQGAVCVTEWRDIWDDLQLAYDDIDDRSNNTPVCTTATEKMIWALLSQEPYLQDTLVEHVKEQATVGEVVAILAQWELQGWVKFSGGWYARAR